MIERFRELGHNLEGLMHDLIGDAEIPEVLPSGLTTLSEQSRYFNEHPEHVLGENPEPDALGNLNNFFYVLCDDRPSNPDNLNEIVVDVLADYDKELERKLYSEKRRKQTLSEFKAERNRILKDAGYPLEIIQKEICSDFEARQHANALSFSLENLEFIKNQQEKRIELMLKSVPAYLLLRNAGYFHYDLVKG